MVWIVANFRAWENLWPHCLRIVPACVKVRRRFVRQRRKILCDFHPFKSKPTMRYLKTIAQRFIREEDGPTAVEYAVMLALIVLVCIASIVALGQQANSTFEFISNAF